ncbi:hypothetical protein Droror1_Dr00013609 [Drosera rotundifolia]
MRSSVTLCVIIYVSFHTNKKSKGPPSEVLTKQSKMEMNLKWAALFLLFRISTLPLATSDSEEAIVAPAASTTHADVSRHVIQVTRFSGKTKTGSSIHGQDNVGINHGMDQTKRFEEEGSKLFRGLPSWSGETKDHKNEFHFVSRKGGHGRPGGRGFGGGMVGHHSSKHDKNHVAAAFSPSLYRSFLSLIVVVLCFFTIV